MDDIFYWLFILTVYNPLKYGKYGLIIWFADTWKVIILFTKTCLDNSINFGKSFLNINSQEHPEGNLINKAFTCSNLSSISFG